MEENEVIDAILQSNEARKNGLYDYSYKNGKWEVIPTEELADAFGDPNVMLAEEDPTVMDAIGGVSGLIGDVVTEAGGKAVGAGQAVGSAVVGAVKGLPKGLGNFAEQFNRTFIPGYEENIAPWIAENIPGLSELNTFADELVAYDGKAQEVGGEWIGEPLGEFGLTGGALSAGTRALGVSNRFLSNVLGYGATEVIAVPEDEQGMLSMGIEYLTPSSEIKTAILDSLASNEDHSVLMQKLYKAPENFLMGGLVGESLDKAVQSVGTLYKYIKNSPRIDDIRDNINEGLIKAGEDAQSRLDKNQGSVTLGSMGGNAGDIVDATVASIGNFLKKKTTKLTNEDEIKKLQEASIENGKPNVVTLDQAYRKVDQIKKTHKPSKGWVEPKIAVNSKNKGYTVNSKGDVKINWQGERYNFHIPKDGGDIDSHKKLLVNRMVKDVGKIVERAKNGDQKAINILKEANWYKDMRARLRSEFGGLGDVFSDIIGATSANTNVLVNWKFAVDVLKRFTRGDFDEEIKLFEERLKAGETVSGKTITALHKDPNNPFKLITQASGQMYGINSPSTTLALLDMFRQVKKGLAPKTRNFAGNLIGTGNDATIDVWAGRYLRKIAGYKRLAPVSEQGVSGLHLTRSTNDNPEIGGEFGFGQSVFKEANKKLTASGSLGSYDAELANIGDDDLQAIVWFMEKEEWTDNGWTSTLGEGGSLDYEASFAGSKDQSKINQLRGVLRSQTTSEQEKINAQKELNAMEPQSLQRIVLGISGERPNNVPTNLKQAEIAQGLKNAVVEDETVIGFQNNSTYGMFGGETERALNAEYVVREDFDETNLVTALVKAGKDNNQDAVFISKVVGEETPNARPGIELYLNQRQDIDQIKKITDFIAKNYPDIDGFTAITDARHGDRVDLQVDSNTETAGLVGLRLQYIPEFAGGIFDEKTKLNLATRYAEMLFDLEKQFGDINYTKVTHYDTKVFVNEANDTEWINGGTSYAEFLGNSSSKASGEGSKAGQQDGTVSSTANQTVGGKAEVSGGNVYNRGSEQKNLKSPNKGGK